MFEKMIEALEELDKLHKEINLKKEKAIFEHLGVPYTGEECIVFPEFFKTTIGFSSDRIKFSENVDHIYALNLTIKLREFEFPIPPNSLPFYPWPTIPFPPVGIF